jgi:cold-inducible RNA-binding protein
MNIFVGNLAREATEEDLKGAFTAFGQVASATIIKDKFTRESRGFGFVEMPDANEGKAAIAGLNGTELKGRAITVNEARPRTDRREGGGGGGGDRRGGGGGGGGWKSGGGRRSW